jgi:hypothetical protein
MKPDYIKSIIPGKFNKVEEEVLRYLYAHPDDKIGTMDLVATLKPQQNSNAEQSKEAFKDIQHAVETFITAQLVRGKRRSAHGDVYYEHLALTRKGEAEAIMERHRVKTFLIDRACRPPRNT